MPKKRIHINERQLYRLIEQSINEISTQTKMSAEQKAGEDSKYWGKVLSSSPYGSEDFLKALKMILKRNRQGLAFARGVDDDCYYLSPTRTDDYGRKKIKDMTNFVDGNSYYEKGRGWVNPDDEGYDMERSEPWAKIRKKNEAVARKVTESIIRELKKNSKPIKKMIIRNITP